MTLCTHVYVRDRVEPAEAFAYCRELLGATDKITTHNEKATFGDHWSMGNDLGQGLDALLWVDYRPSEPLRTPEQEQAHTKWCEDDCDGSSHEPACWIAVAFDTAYSYRKGNEGCGHLHVRLVTELGLWLDERDIGWLWENEFTGERHEGYERLPDIAGGGEEARAWYLGVVVPAIPALAATFRSEGGEH